MSKRVSFSQFSIYLQCPHKWKLDYIEKRRSYQPSIHTVFGTAFHNTVQKYLEVVYTKSAKEADCLDLRGMLKEEMVSEYKKGIAQFGGHFSSAKELEEFWFDGVAILDKFRKSRATYFPSKKHKLVAIELPLNLEVRPNVKFVAYLDIVIKDERDDTYKVIDFKTSTMGWKNEKKDISKTSQLILYKKYYADTLGVSQDKIEVEFLIVRRKIIEESTFPMKRLQSFVPSQGKPTVNKVHKLFEEFLDTAFTPEGEYNEAAHYPAKENKLCKYCEYNKNGLCPVGKRVLNG